MRGFPACFLSLAFCVGLVPISAAEQHGLLLSQTEIELLLSHGST